MARKRRAELLAEVERLDREFLRLQALSVAGLRRVGLSDMAARAQDMIKEFRGWRQRLEWDVPALPLRDLARTVDVLRGRLARVEASLHRLCALPSAGDN
jgi:hypothetical protein